MASRWWDPEGEFKPLHQINPLRLDYISHLSGGLQGKKILDVGCGGGILSESMAKLQADVTGIDLGDGPLEIARLHLLESGLEVDYRKIPVEQLAEEMPGQFDVVTCMEMLEHVPDPGSIIAACKKLVKPDGHVFFSTINRNPAAWLTAVVGAEHIMKMLPVGTHHYQKFIRPSELESWCRATDLKLDDCTGIIYNPLSRAFTTGKNLTVNYMGHATPL
ncbi:bifunctional 3-demethylubiquinol 3-O-methyltransferase/2-polyprenyl-6-hydroxyphenol methylase [Pelagibaculum spongiae]|uniref:Ubiquinone biosynthesis O-methyltransferase n=2 Tax=Pelagibaculum spongiae TaxID=2080658 RepID=A0A2V1H3M4_9GAMM|nr:bifunctional 3-demethylubiquinol 3-O-methyltransferase/2-polyprenyl-6-hydroxyphenol methylase [Pelagibaculum spongiae]